MRELTKDPIKAAEQQGLDRIGVPPPQIRFEREEKVTSDKASFWDIFNYIQKCQTVEFKGSKGRFHPVDDTGFHLKIEEGKPKKIVDISVDNGQGVLVSICKFEFDLEEQIVMMFSMIDGRPDYENSFPIPIDSDLQEEPFPINYGDQIKGLLLWIIDPQEA